MFKIRSPREIIECVDRPDLEEAWVKFARKELVPVSIERSSDSVRSNTYGLKNHSHIHTHPSTELISRYPSDVDYFSFMCLRERRTMVVAQTDPENGKLVGYFIVRKTRRSPLFNPLSRSFVEFFDVLSSFLTLGFYSGSGIFMNSINLMAEYGTPDFNLKFDKFMSRYELQYRYVSTKEDVSKESKLEATVLS